MIDTPLAPVPPGVDSEAWRAACEAARSYCGWHVAPMVSETVTMDGSGTNVLFLPTLHMVELVAVSLDTYPLDVAATDTYDWSTYGTLRLYSDVFPDRKGGIVIEMLHGFDSCPTDLLAAIETVARRSMMIPSGAGYVVAGPFSMQIPESAQSGVTGFTAMQREVLDRYRIPFRP
jgi:hypothetical protein